MNKNNDKSQNFAPKLLLVGIGALLFGILMFILAYKEECMHSAFIVAGNIMAVPGTTVIILFVSAWIKSQLKKQDEKKKDTRMRLLVAGIVAFGACALIWLIVAYFFKQASGDLVNFLFVFALSVIWNIFCNGFNEAKDEIKIFFDKKNNMG